MHSSDIENKNMDSNSQDFDPRNFDINDPELQPLLIAWAAQHNCTVDELRASLQKVVDLPNIFGEDPLTNLEGFIQLNTQLPREQLQAAYQQALAKNPEKVDLTFEAFVGDVLKTGAMAVEKEIEQDRESRQRLENLLKDI